MIYTDGIHLIGDTLEELHKFAKSIDLKKCWFEGVKKGHPHYDLWGNKINKALEKGAIKVSTRELVRIIKNGKNS